MNVICLLFAPRSYCAPGSTPPPAQCPLQAAIVDFKLWATATTNTILANRPLFVYSVCLQPPRSPDRPLITLHLLSKFIAHFASDLSVQLVVHHTPAAGSALACRSSTSSYRYLSSSSVNSLLPSSCTTVWEAFSGPSARIFFNPTLTTPHDSHLFLPQHPASKKEKSHTGTITILKTILRTCKDPVSSTLVL